MTSTVVRVCQKEAVEKSRSRAHRRGTERLQMHLSADWAADEAERVGLWLMETLLSPFRAASCFAVLPSARISSDSLLPASQIPRKNIHAETQKKYRRRCRW